MPHQDYQAMTATLVRSMFPTLHSVILLRMMEDAVRSGTIKMYWVGAYGRINGLKSHRFGGRKVDKTPRR